MRGALAVAGMSLFLAGLAIACSSSSSSNQSANVDAGEDADASDYVDADCNPATRCSASAPRFYQADVANQCLVPVEITLNEVCATPGNPCYPSAGDGTYCTIAPDGTVYLLQQSDDYMYSANGWHFVYAYGTNGSPPLGQSASPAQQAECFAAECFPFCSGPSETPFYYDCPTDAGSD